MPASPSSRAKLSATHSRQIILPCSSSSSSITPAHCDHATRQLGTKHNRKLQSTHKAPCGCKFGSRKASKAAASQHCYGVSEPCSMWPSTFDTNAGCHEVRPVISQQSHNSLLAAAGSTRVFEGNCGYVHRELISVNELTFLCPIGDFSEPQLPAATSTLAREGLLSQGAGPAPRPIPCTESAAFRETPGCRVGGHRPLYQRTKVVTLLKRPKVQGR